MAGSTVDVTISYFAGGGEEGDPKDVFGAVVELFSRAEYDVEKETMGYARVQAFVRVACTGVTALFTFFYVGAVCRGWSDALGWEGGGLGPGGAEWWLTPMAVVPERRFVVALLLCLLMIQNPVALIMQVSDAAAGSKSVRALADVVVGLGVHAMLFSWLCIVEGMRYHTAEAVLLRGKRQRELEVAREAHEHVRAAREQQVGGGDEGFGDVDASYFEHLQTAGLFLKHGESELRRAKRVAKEVVFVKLQATVELAAATSRTEVSAAYVNIRGTCLLTSSLRSSL